jgi:photosystem II stability/assembly factor-like uncharacterized protein
MMKYTHCIIIALMLCVVGSAFAAPSDWSVVRQADWRTHFRDVTFADQQNAWAVGDSGVIAVTSDGGKTWVAQESGVTTDLKRVVFVDAKNGWITGSAGILLHTTNGGAKWQTQKFDLGMDMTDVFFFDAKVGWATGNIPQPLGNEGHLFYTTDGGNTWKAQDKFKLPLIDILFLDSKTGWIVGGQTRGEDIAPMSFIIYTSDGGKTWTQQKSELQNPLLSVYFADKNNGWTFGMGGMFKTTDGGITWVSMAKPPNAPPEGEQPPPPRRRMPEGLLKTSFVSASDILGVNMTGQLVRIADDGKLEPVRVPARRLTCVDFISPQVGCVAGEYGALLITSDGGQTWVSQAKVNADTLRSVAVTTKDNIICVGDNGVAVQSTDAGKTWSPAKIGVEGNFKAVTFADANTGWILAVTGGGGGGRPGPGGPEGGGPGGGGPEGVILKTSDGGKTWTEQVRGPEYNLNTIKSLNAQNVYACGPGGAWKAKTAEQHGKKMMLR